MKRYPYDNGITYAAEKHIEEVNKEIKEERQKENPDFQKLNKMREERYMPGLFSDIMGYYDRFRSPW